MTESNLGRFIFEAKDDDAFHPDTTQGVSEGVVPIVSREFNPVDGTVRVLRSEVLARDLDCLFGALRNELAPDEVTLTVIIRFAVVEVQLPTGTSELVESDLEGERVAFH